MKKIFLLAFLFVAAITFSQTAPEIPPEELPQNQAGSEEISDPDTEALSETDGALAQTEDGEEGEELSLEDDDSGMPSSEDLGIPPSTEPAKTPRIRKATNETDTIEFPQWAKDLRRGEIVAFGAFPISVFFSKMFMDLYRMSLHNWDRRYAPWPATVPGGPGLTKDEIKLMFSIAASASVAISVADHLIIRHKRKKAAAAE